MERKKRILIIDDEENMLHMLSSILQRLHYETTCAANGLEGVNALRNQSFDFILCDIRMPKMDGMQFLKQARQLNTEATVIMMSAYGTTDTALAAMRAGAYDYISKPFKTDEIELTLRKAEERESLRQDNRKLRYRLASLEEKCTFGRMIARSASMLEVFNLAAKVAPHPTTVLITGESGTGKELIARGIHQMSGPSAGEFVAINCGGIPASLIESELFGHTKGSFTGADSHHQGLFATAHGGTILLDEIGELPVPSQVKLLRVLQEGEIQPIGATHPRKIDVRVLAATSRNLEERIDSGHFRQDLYYRLNVVHIHLPPLQERTEDIPLLSDLFVKRYAARGDSEVSRIAPATMALLLNHGWPGNVRELENVIERAVILADSDDTLLPSHLPENLHCRIDMAPSIAPDGSLSIKNAQKSIESSLIKRALQITEGNKTKASELLEISYPSLLSKIKEYRLTEK